MAAEESGAGGVGKCPGDEGGRDCEWEPLPEEDDAFCTALWFEGRMFSDGDVVADAAGCEAVWPDGGGGGGGIICCDDARREAARE